MQGNGTPSEPVTSARWDPLAAELQALRLAAGDPSFAELARRVSQQRAAAGLDEHAARVARTTVYDAFRPGRTRVNLTLVRELAHALGADDATVDEWVARCTAPAPAPQADAASQVPEGPAAPSTPSAPERAGARRVVLLMTVCVLVNLLGRFFVDLLTLPVYLDMVGTAVAALALGPWHGVAVGLATNVLGVASSGTASLPFALVNVVGALVWGYGARRLGLSRTLPRFLGLNVLAAGACTLVAVPILLLAFGGSTGHGEDTLSATFLRLTDTVALSVWFSNSLTSLADKIISGFVALVAVSALPAALRHGLVLPVAPPPGPGVVRAGEAS